MPLHWVAVYGSEPGEHLEQYNADGSLNRYADIDRERLREFTLLHTSTLPPEPNQSAFVFSVVLRPGKRLIYRRRVQKHSSGAETIWHIVGWQENVRGRNVQSVAWVHDNGVPIILRGGFSSDALFSPPVVHPNEGESGMEFVEDE